MPIPDRIRELRRVPAGALVPHPRNWRTHTDRQRDVLRGVLTEIGYADALLARELPDGRLQLLDGHLRAETTPDQDVPVLIVDVDEADANKLLLTLDPLAALAGTDTAALAALLPDAATDDPALRALWADLAAAQTAAHDALDAVPATSGDAAHDALRFLEETHATDDIYPRIYRPTDPTDRRAERSSAPELYQLVVECDDEAEQRALFDHLRTAGHRVRVVNL
ncbi:MAG: hypothetical protein QM811_18785 [Pirellulales bacterium]